jgi:hypothetical protein
MGEARQVVFTSYTMYLTRPFSGPPASLLFLPFILSFLRIPGWLQSWWPHGTRIGCQVQRPQASYVILHSRPHDLSHEFYGYRAKVSACVEALLLSIVKNKFNFHRCNTTHGLLMSTYSAFFFFLSATLSRLVLTKKSGEFLVWAPWNKDTVRWGHGSKCSRIWLTVHRECTVFIIRASPPHPQVADLVSLIAGTVSVIVQALLYSWLQESVLVRGLLSVIMAFGVLFLTHLIRLLLRD